MFSWTIAYINQLDHLSTKVAIYNYFRFAYPEEHSSDDLVGRLDYRLIDFEGMQKAAGSAEIACNGSYVLDVSKVIDSFFEGSIRLRMSNVGGLGRLSGSSRPIDTSFFTKTYFENSLISINHELFAEVDDAKYSQWGLIWSSIDHDELQLAFIDNRGSISQSDCQSWFRVKLRRLGEIPQVEAPKIQVPRCGGLRVSLVDFFPNLKPDNYEVEIEGYGIEQPVSLHLKEGVLRCIHHC